MRQSAGTSGLVRVCTLYSRQEKERGGYKLQYCILRLCLDETQKKFAMESC